MTTATRRAATDARSTAPSSSRTSPARPRARSACRRWCAATASSPAPSSATTRTRRPATAARRRAPSSPAGCAPCQASRATRRPAVTARSPAPRSATTATRSTTTAAARPASSRRRPWSSRRRPRPPAARRSSTGSARRPACRARRRSAVTAALPEGTEQCDDGNTKPLDGCSADCQWEPSCPNGACLSRCGDGLLFDFDADGNGTHRRGVRRRQHPQRRRLLEHLQEGAGLRLRRDRRPRSDVPRRPGGAPRLQVRVRR